MQHTHQQWIRPLIAAFGAKGIVALAWWLGALHAERIRERHDSFPMLQLNGEAGTGKSVLLDVLWRLLGEEHGQTINVGQCSALAMAARLDRSENRPNVLEEFVASPPTDRDWLQGAYAGTDLKVSRQPKSGPSQEQSTSFRLRGALVLINPAFSTAIDIRSVAITLSRDDQTSTSRSAVESLLTMPLAELAEFKAIAENGGDLVAQHLASLTKNYWAAITDAGIGSLTEREILNHAQLCALVDALRELVGLSAEQANAAHLHITRMAQDASIPY